MAFKEKHTHIDLSLPAERVVRTLDQVIEWRGKPQALISAIWLRIAKVVIVGD